MGSDAVFATVTHADGDVDQFADQRVELAGAAHDFLEGRPSPLQRGGMVGEGFPKVVDFVRPTSGSNVIEDLSYQPGTLFVFDQRLNGMSPVTELLGFKIILDAAKDETSSIPDPASNRLICDRTRYRSPSKYRTSAIVRPVQEGRSLYWYNQDTDEAMSPGEKLSNCRR